ncbi:SYN3 protein, partial [Probosciger aterrimus]|nr:SYN3 protein [Probosciger aterrimus]
PGQGCFRADIPGAPQFSHLVRLQRELGPEAFPLVPQRFCTRPRGLLTAPTFPMMVTLSPAPAGVGKVRPRPLP